MQSKHCIYDQAFNVISVDDQWIHTLNSCEYAFKVFFSKLTFDLCDAKTKV